MSERLSKQLKELKKTEAVFHAMASEVHSLELKLNRLSRFGNAGSAEKEQLRRHLQDLEIKLEKNQQKLNNLRLDIDKIRELQLSGDFRKEFESLSHKHPIVLLPLRLETRFKHEKEELWIRIFPDEIHIDQFDQNLQADEVKLFKQLLGNENPSEPKVRHYLLENLTQALGATRSAWLLRKLEEPGKVDPDSLDNQSYRVARAAALPDRFVAIGIRDEKITFTQPGGLLPAHIPVGPNPLNDLTPAADSPEDALDDPGLLWMRNFDIAVTHGLGIKVGYSKDEQLPKLGLDQLIVLGVASTLSAEESVLQLEELFTAHRYGRGLAFIEPGTPSNNTSQTKSGYQRISQDIERELLPLDELEAKTTQSANSKRLANAFGITSREQQNHIFDQSEHAGSGGFDDVRNMNTALWSVTGGYFLEQMLRPLNQNNPIDKNLLKNCRTHFIQHVSGRGPLPAFRIADQPYAVLPVTSLRDWQANTLEERDFDGKVLPLLEALREHYWNPAVDREQKSSLTRANQSHDPQQSIINALSLQAVSDRFSVHPMLGPEFMKNLALQYGVGSPEVTILQQMLQTGSKQLKKVLETLGFDIPPTLLGECAHTLCDFSISNAIVQQGDLDPESKLDPNYIKWLLTASLREIVQEEGNGSISATRGVPLLYLLLRHALLLELGQATYRFFNMDILEQIEPELPGYSSIGGQPARKTVFDAIKRPVAGTTTSAGQKLLKEVRQGKSGLPARWIDFWQSLQLLTAIPPVRLDLLSRETLDCYSSRLDAWFTSFATSRLHQLMEKQSAGRRLGAYGFVENLKPRNQSEKQSETSSGYIHAPSLNQAATGAILYNGHLTHSSPSNPSTTDNPLSIQLDSNQTYSAEVLANGLRQGYSLAELLGYGFERFLRTKNVTRYIQAFRSAYPGKARLHAAPQNGNLPADTDTDSAVATVVDGLALLRDFQTSNYRRIRTKVSSAEPANPLPATGTNARSITEALQNLERNLDALNDALMVESVHQLLQGNTERSGAALESMSATGTPPPELIAMKTPRTGISFNYRLLEAWKSGATFEGRSELSFISPDIEKWVVHWLGNLDQIAIGVEDSASDQVHLASLADMEISGLDLLYLSTGGDIDKSWLTRRARIWASKKFRNFIDVENAAILFDRFDTLPSSHTALSELEPTIQALRNLLGAGRLLSAKDLSPEPGTTPSPAWSSVTAKQRLAHSATRLSRHVQTLQSLLEELTRASVNEHSTIVRSIENVLDNFHRFSIPEATVHTVLPQALPIDNAVDNNRALIEPIIAQAQLVLIVAQNRLKQFGKSAITSLPDTISSTQLAKITEAAKSLFGLDVPLVLPIKLSNTQQTELPLLWDRTNSTALQDNDPNASELWLHDVSPVRERVSGYNELRRNHAVAHRKPMPLLTVSHLPFEADARWCALEQQHSPNDSKTSVVAGLMSPIDAIDSFELVGWMIDEWQELLPNKAETTGISFHYDSPSSQAPNTILLAMPGVAKGNWSLEELVENVVETTRLMKIRSVATNQLDGLGQLLPALSLPENIRHETISTDLKRARPKAL